MPSDESRLARRLDGVSESVTLNLNARVQAMKALGVNVVNLTAGEPDFHVPDEAKNAVIEALKSNRSKYPPVGGVPELRALVAARTNRQQTGVAEKNPWTADDVVITNGGKQALFNALMAFVDPGDEVLFAAPYWLSYPEMVKIAGGIPRVISTSFETGFKISPKQLRAHLGPKTKGLILNSPCNPTGAVYTQAEYRALGEIFRATREASRAWVVSDEIYDRICFGTEGLVSFLQCCPELKERTVTVNGMSKAFAMTGWRVGWSVAPREITQAMLVLQGQSTSGVNQLSQWASIAALKVPETAFAYQVESFRKRRDIALEILKKASKIKVLAPEGAFYAFLGVEDYLRSGEDSVGFAERLLEGAQVAVVPGTPFGAADFIRVSFATEVSELEEGCRRIVSFLS